MPVPWSGTRVQERLYSHVAVRRSDKFGEDTTHDDTDFTRCGDDGLGPHVLRKPLWGGVKTKRKL
jgi:hypothetical protein